VQRAELDIRLFNSIKGDDRLALNTLFANYYSRLCAFANRFLENKEEAEEVVADVFCTLWQKRKQLSIDRNVKMYLYISVKHAAFAAIKKRAPFADSLEATEESLTECSTPENIFVFKELENHFEFAVNNLPARCKQVFLLKWKDDLSYHEIGEILAISEKTVENHLVNAMLKIKATIRAYQNLQYSSPT
jgi:RNA polymerase sigma-70 factor (ECF subfamily)